MWKSTCDEGGMARSSLTADVQAALSNCAGSQVRVQGNISAPDDPNDLPTTIQVTRVVRP